MGSRTALVAVLAALALGLVVVVPGVDARLPGDNTGYEPEQPIRFSHRLHAGDLAVPCLYCHSGAERSRHAGVPSASLCMSCHKFVAAPLAEVRAEEVRAAAEGREPRPVISLEIRKLYAALGLGDDGKPLEGAEPRPIRWVRIHDLPDFAVFDHRNHVAAGLSCSACHGPVEAMERVRQFADLGMGWCVDCHRTTNAIGLPDGRPSAASTDCSACHH
jgi:hypothetical protein